MATLMEQNIVGSVTPPEPDDNHHIIVGIYLVIIGILGTFGNGVIIIAFLKFRQLATAGHALLINLCVADLGIIGFGFPFSASSSFARRWLYGDVGCQVYAFGGFLFGSASIGTLMMLAIDRCLVLSGRADDSRYKKMILFIWLYALFWSVMPLVGWGQYNYEPSITTCTIDWRHNDASYKSFVIVYFFFGFVVPAIVMAICYSKTIQKIKYGQLQNQQLDWANETNITTLSILLVLGFVVFWSAYAVVCMWTVFAHPDTVPFVLSLVPPLLAKASTVCNPLLYVLVNERLRKYSLAVVLCRTPPIEVPTVDPAETARMNAELDSRNNALHTE